MPQADRNAKRQAKLDALFEKKMREDAIRAKRQIAFNVGVIARNWSPLNAKYRTQ